MSSKLGMAALAAGLLTISSQAEAALTLAIDSLAFPGVEVIAQDNAPINTSTPFGFTNTSDLVAGSDILVGSGGIPIFVSTFTAVTLLPSTLMLTASITNIGAPTSTFLISLTDTDFIALGQNFLTGVFSSTVTGMGAISATGFVDPTNQPFGFGGGSLGSVDFGPFGPGSSVASDTSDPFGLLAVPFSLNQIVTMDLGIGATGTVTFMLQAITQQVTEVIEPGTFSLMALAVIALGVMRERFSRFRQVVASYRRKWRLA